MAMLARLGIGVLAVCVSVWCVAAFVGTFLFAAFLLARKGRI